MPVLETAAHATVRVERLPRLSAFSRLSIAPHQEEDTLPPVALRDVGRPVGDERGLVAQHRVSIVEDGGRVTQRRGWIVDDRGLVGQRRVSIVDEDRFLA